MSGYEIIYLSMEGFNILVAIGLGVGLFLLARRNQLVDAATAKRGEIEDEMKASLQTAEQKLHETNIKLVDERIRHWTHDVGNDMHTLKTTIHVALNDFKQRLADGDDTFDTLDDKRQKLELGLSNQFAELKIWMRDNSASKADMKEHQASVERRFSQIEQQIRNAG